LTTARSALRKTRNAISRFTKTSSEGSRSSTAAPRLDQCNPSPHNQSPNTEFGNVNGKVSATEGLLPKFNIAQPIKGQHSKTPALDKTGIVTLSCEAGHPWMSAFVLVADHPYVAITKNDGEFVIANVPVGTYRIKMWHEGVTLTSNNKALQRYDYEDPYETTKDVTVTANGEVVVDFDLTLRDRAAKGN